MRKLRGADGFETYYDPILNQYCNGENCTTLLNQKNYPVLLFIKEHEKYLQELWKAANLTWHPLAWYPYALEWPNEVSLGTELPGYRDHLIYPMNASSLLPVMAIDPQPGDVILDACAAPGGKTLALHNLATDNSIIANDISPTRNKAMRKLFTDFEVDIPAWHRKAEIIYQESPDTFDKILLDAPCSSEKHVFQNIKELSKWSTNRIKQLHIRQIALISGLILALKPGGILVYSTCAITPEENEAVIAEILKRKSDLVRLLAWSHHGLPGQAGIPCDYVKNFDLNSVRWIFPSSDSPLDPMFVAVFQRL